MDPLHASCTMLLSGCPDLSYDDRRAAIKAACEFAKAKGYNPEPRSLDGFHVMDPDDMLDNEDITEHVFRATGLKTDWLPMRLDEVDLEAPKITTVPINSAVDEKTTMAKTKRGPRGPYKKHIDHSLCTKCGLRFKSPWAKPDHYRRNKYKPASV